MRLIRTTDFTLHEFLPSQVPTYAVLSHTWTYAETSFQDYAISSANTNKPGIAKIRRFCEKAAQDGHQYAWVDTCCIDKLNLVELSESINLMFKWYQDSVCCYVYMSDVTIKKPFDSENPHSFARSRWFTRGWTLQELIAPKTVRFFSQEWEELGDRTGLAGVIEEVSGIDAALSRGSRSFWSYSVAQRMSWAAWRVTTREEDIAYCLLGLFRVNMPMLYGEGMRAFRRLQEEIVKINSDHSIFAWAHTRHDPAETGLVAPHPRNFRDSGHFEDVSGLPGLDGDPPTWNARGVSINGFSNSKTDSIKGVTRELILMCAEASDPSKFARLELTDVGADTESYMRVHRRQLERSVLIGSMGTLLVRHERPAEVRTLQQRLLRFNITADKESFTDTSIAYTPSHGPQPISENIGANPEWYAHWNTQGWKSKHVPSDPRHNRYIIPLFPNTLIAVLQILLPWQTFRGGNSAWFVCVRLTSDGQIGSFTFNSGEHSIEDEVSEDFLEKAKPLEPQPDGSVWIDGDHGFRHRLQVSATDLYNLRYGGQCEVNVAFERYIPAEEFENGKIGQSSNLKYFYKDESSLHEGPVYRLTEAGLELERRLGNGWRALLKPPKVPSRRKKFTPAWVS